MSRPISPRRHRGSARPRSARPGSVIWSPKTEIVCPIQKVRNSRSRNRPGRKRVSLTSSWAGRVGGRPGIRHVGGGDRHAQPVRRVDRDEARVVRREDEHLRVVRVAEPVDAAQLEQVPAGVPGPIVALVDGMILVPITTGAASGMRAGSAPSRVWPHVPLPSRQSPERSPLRTMVTTALRCARASASDGGGYGSPDVHAPTARARKRRMVGDTGFEPVTPRM